MRPTVIAGFAKLVELVKKYAEPMYAPTAAGANAPRLVRASEKITSSRPSVAITSANRCAGDARCLVEMLTAASANIPFATIAPTMQPPTWAGHVGERVAPAEAAEARVDERHDRVEMTARHGPEHQDDREQPGGGRRRVLEQLETDVAGGEALRGDPRADHDRGQERGAEQLGEQSPSEVAAHGPVARSLKDAVVLVAQAIAGALVREREDVATDRDMVVIVEDRDPRRLG